MSLASIEQQHFRRVCSKYATGITILTVLDPCGIPHGMTVNSFTSVSLSPPLVLVCIDRQTSILNHFLEGTHFAIALSYDVLPKSRWAETELKSGDEIEIITPRQGG